MYSLSESDRSWRSQPERTAARLPAPSRRLSGVPTAALSPAIRAHAPLSLRVRSLTSHSGCLSLSAERRLASPTWRVT
eukprot:1595130-Rhodomonas_salina.1